MPLLPRATDSQDTEWRNAAEGFWRFVIGKPDVFEDKTWGGMKVRWPLELTPEEKTRMLDEIGEPPTGVQQSYRSSYRVGLSIRKRKNGEWSYLVDFLCAAMGTENGKKVRKWIEAGGGPRTPEDKDDQAAELELIQSWLDWWEGLEVFGTITHSEPDKQGRIWANFAGPMPIGSLPNQPEPDYQSLCRGKFRAMREEAGEDPESPAAPPAKATPTPVGAAPKRTYRDVFPDDKDEAF